MLLLGVLDIQIAVLTFDLQPPAVRNDASAPILGKLNSR